MQETWIWSLGQEDPLEKEMATHSSFLAWEIPWTEESGRLQSMGHKNQTQVKQLSTIHNKVMMWYLTVVVICISLIICAPKNWCFWSVVLEKTLESPLHCKEIQLVHLKRDQSWVFIGRTDAEAETPVLWSPHTKNWVIGKDPDAGREWGQEEKGTTEDEMAGWHHRLGGHEFQ